MGGYAWVTLATNDAYSLGALVLAHSLRRVGTKYELACMVTPGVTTAMREKLAAVFSLVQEVNVLDSKDEAHLSLLARPELGITFTKLHCWRLTQYEKCVFVDADALVVRNCDELFEREELSAAPDVGWPDCFNSGVFVYRPSQQTFASIVSFAAAKGSFDGGDQGLLNMYFSDWATKDISKHLPFIYNMCSTATYSYLPAFKQFGEDVRIIHFIGITKPWLQYFDTLTGVVQPPAGSGHLQPLLQLWWNIFCELVHPQLSTSMTGIAGALAQLTLGAARSEQQIALEEQMRKQSWEQGHIDYMGQDSFDNIWKKICETLSQAQQRQASPPKEDKPKDEETTSVPVAPAVQPAAIVEPKTPTVETDSTQEQPLVRKLSEEKLPAVPAETPAAQPSEQKTTVLPAEESITVETAATRVSSEPAQSAPEEDGGVKPPTQESQDVKPCETCTEVPSPRPPVELPSSAKTIAEQCEHASAQEAASREKSENAESPTPSAEPRAPTAICKPAVSEPATPVVAQGETAPASADDKAQVSAPVTPSCATQPAIIGAAADTQDMIAPAVTPNEGSIRDTAEPRGATDVTQPLTIDPSERRAEMLLTASEISTVSPVPIQVAESVLQTEPKESVSDSAASVSDQAIAATVTAITNVAPTTAVEQAVRLNGLACDSGKRDDVAVPSPAPTEEPASDSVMEKAAAPLPAAEEKVEPISSSVLSAEKPAEQVEEATKPTEQVPTEAAPTAQIATSEAKETKSPEQQVATTEVTGAKPAEQIAKATTAEEKASEQPEKIEITGAIVQSEATAKIETAGTESTEQAPEAQVSESPTESVEAKAINVPSTPTVTEATPPTSPSVESAQETAESQEKAAKKSLKKSDSADGTDGEGSDKKAAVKKTVKKVTKKPKPPKSEEAVSAVPEAALTGDNSQSKTKKTVKVTKKTGAKSLEADTTVPETPPPLTTATTTTTSSAAAATAAVAAAVAATPDVPVPPRRKTKAATTSAKGTASKKPEAEE